MAFTLNLYNRPHTCTVCGEKFEDNSGTSRYCLKCRPKAKTKVHVDYTRKRRKRLRKLKLKPNA